jgi:hypothetical protein
MQKKKLLLEAEASGRAHKKAVIASEAGTIMYEEEAAIKAQLEGQLQELKRVGMWGFAIYDFGAPAL